MLDESTVPQFESFLVRFWQERASRVWRGKVIHLSSQTCCDFATLEQAEAFIHRFVLLSLPESLPADPASDALPRHMQTED